MIDFNYTKEAQYIPLPLCDDEEIAEKSCFIDANRISNIPVTSTSPLLSPLISTED